MVNISIFTSEVLNDNDCHLALLVISMIPKVKIGDRTVVRHMPNFSPFPGAVTTSK